MITHQSSRRLELRLLATAMLIVSLPLFAAAASAQNGAGRAITDPAEIDRAVIEFTGVPIGEVGGARVPADRRLRLAACQGPLDLSWHGTRQSTVQVACPGPDPWRIFIATRPAAQAEAAAKMVSRGDPVTLVVRGRGFSVQQTGEAMEDGAQGDWIAIRTARDATPVRARIERPGLAVIPAS
ncbi:flagella basal body P-ring formation protein FlgA [Erythrobacter aurantius]|uniref:flagella basal body P-ring formation protein FlgA n=1 Tax=Erythrobacter aurantius TaxID=2909249 RepID=UPI00207AA18F|nr:flagella basal body P-ring formation protein FlgA [Erythrobacter aurantius]